MSNKISPERKSLYYIGMGLIVLGFILFFSSFFIAFNDDGFNPFYDSGMPPFFKRALIGMICIIVGGILMNIGARGAAGSGVILDPEKARDDLKPYSSAAGGMISDVIENIDVVNDRRTSQDKKEVIHIVKVKCQSCGELNDEDAKFCKSCGDKI
ncbi:MAG: zinc ribbon domain-containing protein [Tissierellaceae bacterium]|nr:zinc ribbon domain-containing protein [Tissierellaceae bacterium]